MYPNLDAPCRMRGLSWEPSTVPYHSLSSEFSPNLMSFRLETNFGLRLDGKTTVLVAFPPLLMLAIRTSVFSSYPSLFVVIFVLFIRCDVCLHLMFYAFFRLSPCKQELLLSEISIQVCFYHSRLCFELCFFNLGHYSTRESNCRSVSHCFSRQLDACTRVKEIVSLIYVADEGHCLKIFKSYQ